MSDIFIYSQNMSKTIVLLEFELNPTINNLGSVLTLYSVRRLFFKINKLSPGTSGSSEVGCEPPAQLTLFPTFEKSQ